MLGTSPFQEATRPRQTETTQITARGRLQCGPKDNDESSDYLIVQGV